MSMQDDVGILERVADDIEHRLDQLEHLDFDLQCEGLYHSRALQGHVPAQPASWYLIAPCHGARLMICDGRRAWLATRGTLQCTVCRVEWLIERWHVEPIPGASNG